MTKKTAEEIVKLYQDPKTGLKDLSVFAKQNKLSLKDVKEALASEEAYNLNKPSRENFPREKIIVEHIEDIWSCDLMDVSNVEKFNDGFRFLLIIYDVLTHYVFCIPLKDKTGKSVAGAFSRIFFQTKRVPKKIWVDEGKEFFNKEVEKLMKEKNVILYHTNSENKSVFAERFIRTLRLRLARLADSTHSPEYITDLQNIIKNYNDTPSESLNGKAPSQINKKNENKFVKPEVKAPSPSPNLKLGDFVRIQLNRGVFDKESGERWSREIFRINSISLTNPTTYHIIDLQNEPISGKFYIQELNKILPNKDNVYRVEKIFKRRIRNGVREVLVKYLGYGEKFNEWIPEKDLKGQNRVLTGGGLNLPLPLPNEGPDAYSKRLNIPLSQVQDFFNQQAIPIAQLNINAFGLPAPTPSEGLWSYWDTINSKLGYDPKDSHYGLANLIYSGVIKDRYNNGKALQDAIDNEGNDVSPSVQQAAKKAFLKGVEKTAENGVVRDALKVAGPTDQIIGSVIPFGSEVFDALGTAIDTAGNLVPTEEDDINSTAQSVIDAVHGSGFSDYSGDGIHDFQRRINLAKLIHRKIYKSS